MDRFIDDLSTDTYILHFHNNVTSRLVVAQVRTRKNHCSYELV